MSRTRTKPILRRLELGELVLGERVPGHVRDSSGRILLRAGQRLTSQHVDWLSGRGSCGIYADADWPKRKHVGDLAEGLATQAELLQALRRRNPSRAGATKVRRYERHEWRTALKVTIEVRAPQMYCRRELGVRTCDVSLGGFSFVCQQYVHLGTIVFTRFETLPHRPIIKAVVQYCELVSGREHRIGVQFLPLDSTDIVPFS